MKDTPSNPSKYPWLLAFILVLVATPSWACTLGDGPINVRTCGATGTGQGDDGPAIQRALDLSEQTANKPVYLPTGLYRVTQPLRVRQGTMVLGEGSQGSTPSYGSTLLVAGHGDGLVWDGAGNLYSGTGGGLRDLLIVKENGFVGGTGVAIRATSDSQRPGEMMLENVLVYGRGTGQWDHGLHIDGRNADTDGARGVRSVTMQKFRVASCRIDYECILIEQATHVSGTHVQVDTGNGSGRPGGTLRGNSTNINLANAIFHGTMVVQSGVSHVNLHGRFTELQVLGPDVVGTAVVSGGLIRNDAKQFKILSHLNPEFRARLLSTRAAGTGDGRLATVPFESLDYNYANAFDLSRGEFVAPAAGRYRFRAQLGLGGLSLFHARYELSLVVTPVSGMPRSVTAVGNPRSLSSTGVPNATIDVQSTVELQRGDRVGVKVKVLGGTGGVTLVGLPTSDFTFFTGEAL